MKLYPRMLLVLTSVGLVSGGLLVAVSTATRERIALNQRREIEAGIIRVVPGCRSSRSVHEEKDFAVYAALDEGGEVLGYAIKGGWGGFQDKIVYLLGVNPDLTRIHRLTILDQKETPGLGAKITDQEAFLRFWEDKDSRSALVLRKPPLPPEDLGPSEVNTITGATISAQAVLSGVNAHLERSRRLLRDGKLGGGE